MRHHQRIGTESHAARSPRRVYWSMASFVPIIVASLLLSAPVAGAAPDAPTASCVWHTVVTGDTLGDLGWTYHSSALAIARLNHIPDPDLIFPGQRFCIPVPTLTRARNTAANSASSTSAASGTSGTSAPSSAALSPAGGLASGAQSFIRFVLPYARRAHAATGWPTSLILAQWGLEQGWHLPSYTGYNFGNSGALPGEPTVPGLNVPGSPTAFAYAPTPEDGLRIYIRVAHLSFYAAVAPAAASAGVDAAARALGRSPWDAAHYTATNDPGSWLVSILHTYNLYQYD